MHIFVVRVEDVGVYEERHVELIVLKYPYDGLGIAAANEVIARYPDAKVFVGKECPIIPQHIDFPKP